MPAKVDEAKCTGCKKCVEICPNGSIAMQGEKAKVSAECIDCGACVSECESAAIEMV